MRNKYIGLICICICCIQYMTAQITYTYTVYPNDKKQEIDNFGASDCWVMQKFGKYGTEENVNKVADLLFSTENDENGKPKGIGLSLWRMNFGAGSDDNVFGNNRDIRCRTACMLKKNGTWDMSLGGTVGGQFNMLRKAKERGCKYTLGFVNSPPYFMTRSGQTNGGDDPEYNAKHNLDAEGVEKFTSYLADAVERTKEEHGVTFDYIAPVNEPEWHHTGGEGNHSNNIDIRNICYSLSPKLLKKGVNTKIVVSESGQHDYIYTQRDNLGYLYGNKMENFFGNSESPVYVGGLSNVARICSSHDYWTTGLGDLLNKRPLIAKETEKFNAKFWATEYCIGESFDEYMPSGIQGTADLTINYALFIARIIHSDIAIGNASAYHWWLAITDVPYLDGLIFMKKNENYDIAYQMWPNRYGIPPQSKFYEYYGGAEIVPSKALWGFGNFSRFVRPGARRLVVDNFMGVNNMKGIMISAYENTDGCRVVVCINYGESKKTMKISIDGESETEFIPYITSSKAEDNLRPMEMLKSNSTFEMPGRAIVTFVEKSNVGAASDVLQDDISWYIDSNVLTVLGAEGCDIHLYDTLGRCLVSQKRISKCESITLYNKMLIANILKENKVIKKFKVASSK